MTNAETRFNIALRPRKPEGSLGRTAQDGHLDCHTAPELCAQYADDMAIWVDTTLRKQTIKRGGKSCTKTVSVGNKSTNCLHEG